MVTISLVMIYGKEIAVECLQKWFIGALNITLPLYCRMTEISTVDISKTDKQHNNSTAGKHVDLISKRAVPLKHYLKSISKDK